ncbi:MAG: 3-dehydroquinate synthase [Parachlamydiales bacterium]|jgi:3-dehydroquinate synthase
MKKLRVKLKNHSYNIFYENKLLEGSFILDFCQKMANSFVIITHKNLEQQLAKPLLEKFLQRNLKVKLLSFENKEINKTRKTKELIENQILESNYGRDSLIIALGGGIVSDIAGFVASTYMRGIPYVAIPTTLLAMVDASIGGKTGVNTEYGKNTIGVIYHPSAVFIDFDVLKSLSDDEMKNGLVEMLKHTLIMKKKDFYDLLHSSFISQEMIIKSINIKRKIIQKDENDNNLRKILNFGHTICHAIEAGLDYQITHGEALAYGILIESHLSYVMNFLSKKEFEEIYSFLMTKKLLKDIPNLSKEKIISFLKRDKKNILGKNRFVLLKCIGKSINNVEIIENNILNSFSFVVGGKTIC